jgi:hypothetical protein
MGWTENDGTANPSLPGFMLQSEEDLLEQIKIYAPALSDEQLETLLSLYPLSDFIPDLVNHEASKADLHQAVGPGYFQLARILRDILYTCPAIHFAHAMFERTRADAANETPAFDTVRLYALNQTMHAPLWERVGIAYMGAGHGSDAAYIFNGVNPDGAVTDADKPLATALSRALIRFAYSGSPVDGAKKAVDEIADWPVAFSEPGSGVTLEVVGGPYGSGPVTLRDGEEETKEPSLENEFEQEPMIDTNSFGAMETPEVSERKRLLRAQALSKRCAYIQSLAEVLGN